MSLKAKFDILKLNDSGEKAFVIANIMGLPPTTIDLNYKKWSRNPCKCNSGCVFFSSKHPQKKTIDCRANGKCSVNVDKGFEQKKNIPLTTLVIQRKAISLFNELKSNSVQNDDVADFSFTAIGVWLDKFKKRAQLHNIKVFGVPASADNDAAITYIHT